MLAALIWFLVLIVLGAACYAGYRFGARKTDVKASKRTTP